jgi:predicted transcriptional regulator
LFKEEIISFSIKPEKEKMSDDSLSFMERKNAVLKVIENKDKIKSLAKIINEIDEEIERIKNEQTLLLYVRNSVMHEISRIYKDIDDTESRMIIYRSIDRNERNIKEISKQLNLREGKVNELISRVKKTLKTNYFGIKLILCIQL